MEEIQGTSRPGNQSKQGNVEERQTYRLDDAAPNDLAITPSVVIATYSYMPQYVLGKNSTKMNNGPPSQCNIHCQDHGGCPGFEI